MSPNEMLGVEVEWHYGTDWRWEHPSGEGKVIAVCDAPSVLIEKPDGTKMWWRMDLTRPIHEQKGTTL